MQFDIAKNDEGPLRRTTKVHRNDDSDSSPHPKRRKLDEDAHFRERVRNLESHLSIRYGKYIGICYMTCPLLIGHLQNHLFLNELRID